MKAEEVDVVSALEMIHVGIIPTDDPDPVGTEILLHGDIPVIVTGEATREEFLEAAKKLETYYTAWIGSISKRDFSQCPMHYRFIRIEAKHRYEQT